MIIRDYSAPNIRVISEIRGEIHNTNHTLSLQKNATQSHKC